MPMRTLLKMMLTACPSGEMFAVKSMFEGTQMPSWSFDASMKSDMLNSFIHEPH